MDAILNNDPSVPNGLCSEESNLKDKYLAKIGYKQKSGEQLNSKGDKDQISEM